MKNKVFLLAFAFLWTIQTGYSVERKSVRLGPLELMHSVSAKLKKGFEGAEVSALGPRGQAKLHFQDASVLLFFEMGIKKFENKSKLVVHFFVPQKGTDPAKVWQQYPFHCLVMEWDPARETSTLQEVNANQECAISTVKGTLILNFADKLNNVFSVKESHLIDAATVHCENNPDLPEADLGFLQMMRKGSTWYEEFGFQPEKATETGFHQTKEALRNYRPTEILAALTEPKDSHTIAHSLSCKSEMEELVALGKEYSEAHGKNRLGDFMTWLWQNKCREYPRYMNLLFGSDYPNRHFEGCGKFSHDELHHLEWVELYQNFKTQSVPMVKKYP